MIYENELHRTGRIIENASEGITLQIGKKEESAGALNPIRPGGGGLRGPDGQTHSCQSETSYPMMPKLGDF